MKTNYVIYKKRHDVAEIYLNRPEKLNAITDHMMIELDRFMQKAEKDDDIRVILLQGNGRAFCAGGDTGGSFEQGGELFENTVDTISIFNRTLADNRIYDRIVENRKVTIAGIHGYCLGYGLQIASCFDLIIAEEGTKLGLPELKVGWAFSLARLSKIVGEKKAVEFALLGEFIDANEACNLGLINKVAPKGGLQSSISSVLDKIRGRGPLLSWLTKTSIRKTVSADPTSAVLVENLIGALGKTTVDAKEAQQAFTQKREPKFKLKFPKLPSEKIR